jgi:hypothetical protein
MIDYKLSLRDAIDYPRSYHQRTPTASTPNPLR